MPEAYQIKDQFALYFLTPTIVFWLDIFTRKEYRDIVIDSLKYCRKHKHLEIFGYVIMSNHLHLIVRSKNGTLSDTIRDLKKFTVNKILEQIDSVNESRRKWLLSEMAYAARKHKRNSHYQLWTHENHAVELISNKMIDQRLEYLHQNPVKAGFVDEPEDYIYSSARNYTEGRDCLMKVDLLL